MKTGQSLGSEERAMCLNRQARLPLILNPTQLMRLTYPMHLTHPMQLTQVFNLTKLLNAPNLLFWFDKELVLIKWNFEPMLVELLISGLYQV